MDWAHPHYLWLALPAAAVLVLLHRGSTHPMSLGRRRALLAARMVMVLLALLALAAPALRRRTIENLIRHKVIPIINENDAIAVDEIKVGDNDQLAALVTTLVEADALLQQTEAAPRALRGGTSEDSVAQATDPAVWAYFLAGAVAICAMILPGIRGAFLLLMLGKYE